MSSDPKKPFDAPPSETPSVLNKELNLDRRNRQVPSFEQLAAGRPPGSATQQVPPHLTPRNPAAFDVDDDPDPVTRVGGPNAALLAKAAAAAADDDDEPVTRVGTPNQALLKKATVTGSQPALQEPVTAPVGVQRVAAAPQPGARAPQPPPPSGAAPRAAGPAPAQPAAPRPSGSAPTQAAVVQRAQTAPAQPGAPRASGSAPTQAPPAQPAAPRASGSTPAQAAPAQRAPAAQPSPAQPAAARAAPAQAPRAAAGPATLPARPAVPAPAVTAPGPAPRPAAAAPAARAPAPEAATQLAASPALSGARPAAPAPAGPLVPMPRVAAPESLARPWEPSDALTIAASGGPRRDDEATGVLAPRRAPPSPTEFAQQQAQAAAAPRVTASPANYAAAPGPEQAPARPVAASDWDDEAAARTAPVRPAEVLRGAAPSYADEPEPLTAPARRAELPLPPLPAPAPAPAPAALPAALLTTQPGVPGPFAKGAAPGPAFTAGGDDAAAPVEELGVPPEELPSFGDTSIRAALRSDTVTASPAALWRRVGAWLVDLAVVVGLVTGFLAAAVQVIAPGKAGLAQQLLAVALPGAALAGLLAFVYGALFAFLWRGRTPGRRLLGIHLVDTTGHAPGPLRALVRAGLSLVSFGLFLSGFWLALFDRHGQTLHDKLTRTFVVRLQDA
jgi:uncharacterized RDD family membrane protein YckC